MESSKQSYASRTRKRYGGLLRIFLVIVMTSPMAALAQTDHETPSSSEAGHGTHHEESPLTAVWKWGNFLILFGGLGWYLRVPLREFLETRSRSIDEGLASGRLARESALKQMGEIENRMARLDDEVRALRAQTVKEAEEERARILE